MTGVLAKYANNYTLIDQCMITVFTWLVFLTSNTSDIGRSVLLVSHLLKIHGTAPMTNNCTSNHQHQILAKYTSYGNPALDNNIILSFATFIGMCLYDFQMQPMIF